MKEVVGAQRASYRQGLVLGLTMAEIMLLVVFILLLVAGALLQKNYARVQQLEKQIASEEADNASLDELRRLHEELNRVGITHIPENWRELVKIDEGLKQRYYSPLNSRIVLEAVDAMDTSRKNLESKGYNISGIAQIPAVILEKMPKAPPASSIDRSGHNWPPIIRLSEADNYSFELGKAEITPEFKDQLVGKIIPRLLDLIREYDVNVVEVIGHTDEVPIKGLTSNLDSRLIDALRGNLSADELTFSDNAGLAMARASTVARVLIEDSRLAGLGDLRILPLSGAQVITPDEKISEGEYWHQSASRRRIEIRLRRTSAVQ